MQIARRFGLPWLQVDDLRLALQSSRVRLPDLEDTRKLYFFDAPDVWRLPPEKLRDGFVGVGEAMSAAIAKVITNHVATDEPVVLEGDGILPSLLARSDVRHHGSGGRVRAAFVASSNEDEIFANMLERGRGIPGRNESELRMNARANCLYGEWLTAEARHHGLPVLAPQPWDTLADRLIAKCNGTT